jgi:hypothetical protein
MIHPPRREGGRVDRCRDAHSSSSTFIGRDYPTQHFRSFWLGAEENLKARTSLKVPIESIGEDSPAPEP